MLKRTVEKIIFGSKWLLIVFYFGLILTMGIYTYVYIKEIWHLVMEIKDLNREVVLISILEIVDIVMIANLIKMIITGSYNSFVDKKHAEENERVSSGLLKVKMATSLVGVSSIHLLQTFLNTSAFSWPDVNKQLAIHGTFLIGSLILAVVNFLHEKLETHEIPSRAAAHSDGDV